jgi:4-coumarate--CoA ligase
MRLGFVLEEQGIKPGATLLVLVPTCVEWALMLWLSALKCYTLVTLEASLLEPQNSGELRKYISLLAPSIVVVTNQTGAIAMDKARMPANSTLPFVGITIEPLLEPQWCWTSLPAIATMRFPANVEQVPPSTDHPDRIALIIFSSGTSTGRPKGCVRTVGDLLPILSSLKSVPPLRAPAVLISVRNSQSGSPNLLYSAWYSGNAAVLVGGLFDAATTISTMATYRPIATFFMPHMLEMLRQHHSFNADAVASLRFISLIGAVLTTSLLKRTREMFPKARIVANYGMTEVAGIFGWPQGVPKVDDYPAYRGVVSSGMPLPGVKIKIVSEGKAVPRGSPGSLHICGNMVCSAYLNGESSDSFYHEDQERWFITGDCAVVDQQDRVYILGREEYMISKNGVVISPATIENCLMEHTDHRVCRINQDCRHPHLF